MDNLYPALELLGLGNNGEWVIGDRSRWRGEISNRASAKIIALPGFWGVRIRRNF